MNLLRHTLVKVVLGGSIFSVAWAQAPDAKPEPAHSNPPKEGPAAERHPDAIPRTPPTPRAMRRRSRSGAPGGFSFFTPQHFGPGGAMGFGRRMSDEDAKEMEAMDESLSKLKSAKSDSDKDTAKKELSAALDKLFQRDLEHREHEVSDIEARVKKLKDQIAKRKQAKEDILSLQLKTIINESEGLGFPSRFHHNAENGLGFDISTPSARGGEGGVWLAPPAGLPTPEPPSDVPAEAPEAR